MIPVLENLGGFMLLISLLALFVTVVVTFLIPTFISVIPAGRGPTFWVRLDNRRMMSRRSVVEIHIHRR